MRKLVVFAFSVLAIVFSGCISDTSGIVVEKGKMIINNQRFASHMSLMHYSLKETETGCLHVQVVLENSDYGDIRFQYLFEWYDKDGMLLEETSPMWRTLRMHGKDRKALECVSENKLAKDFRLAIRSL